MRSLFHSGCTIFDYFFREACSVHWSTWFIWCNINFCFTWFFLQISTSAWQMPVHVMQALYAPTPTVPTLVPAATASQEMGHTVKVTSPSYRLLRCVSKKIQDWIFKSERIRKWILRFFTKQINPRSFGSWFVKETEVATRIILDCKTAVFFANARDGNVWKRLTRSVGCEARALHTRGSRLRRFPPSENVRKPLFCSLGLFGSFDAPWSDRS